MAKSPEAITPKEVISRRLEQETPDLESLNRATIMINGRLTKISPGEEVDFSFVREGINYTILQSLAARYLAAGWKVEVYDDRTQDTGILISFP